MDTVTWVCLAWFWQLGEGGAAGGVSVGGGQGCPVPGIADSAMDPTEDTAEPISKAGGAP